jgi:hypothetical protein
MGRPRKIKLEELNRRTMECKCGREVEVLDADVKEVTCCFCTNGVLPVTNSRSHMEREWDKMVQNEKNEKAAKLIVKRNAPRDGAEVMIKERMMGTGKRGRKPTVGAAILNHVNGSANPVTFGSIFNVYTETRKTMNTATDKPEIEKRNCNALVYNMVKTGKITRNGDIYSKIMG